MQKTIKQSYPSLAGYYQGAAETAQRVLKRALGGSDWLLRKQVEQVVEDLDASMAAASLMEAAPSRCEELLRLLSDAQPSEPPVEINQHSTYVEVVAGDFSKIFPNIYDCHEWLEDMWARTQEECGTGRDV